MANNGVSVRTDWHKDGPRYADWIVARGVLLNEDARAYFASRNYPPGMFRCPIARAVIVWSLIMRKSMPVATAKAMLARNDGYESFIEFVERDTVPEEGDGDYGQQPTPEWERLRTHRHVREWSHNLYTLWLENNK